MCYIISFKRAAIVNLVLKNIFFLSLHNDLKASMSALNSSSLSGMHSANHIKKNFIIIGKLYLQ